MSDVSDRRGLPPSVRAFVEDYGVFVVAGFFALVALAGLTLLLVGDEELARRLIDRYGLLALFFIFILEGGMMLYFAPSEALVPFGLAVLAKRPGGYDPAVVVALFAVAVVGATIGQTALFLVARRGGREWLLQKPWFRLGEDRLDRFDAWFDRWGRAAVPLSNALLFTRGMVTVPAGIAEMDVREFAALSALGTLVFESWLALVWVSSVELGLLNFL
jgi:membrane protein DedA with SNARE-associated domain